MLVCWSALVVLAAACQNTLPTPELQPASFNNLLQNCNLESNQHADLYEVCKWKTNTVYTAPNLTISKEETCSASIWQLLFMSSTG